MTPERQTTKQNIWADQKWRTLIILPIMIVAALKGWYAVWGLLFIYWGALAMIQREVFLVETIARDEDPALYWIMITLWIGSGAVYVASAFFPEILL